MRIIPAGLLIVSYFGLTGCANPVESDDPEQDGTIELAASGNPDKNGLDTYKLVYAGILANQSLASSLVNNRLSVPGGLSQGVIDSVCASDHRSLEVLRYVAKCALAPGHDFSITCPGDAATSFKGTYGLANSWGNAGGSCDATCQQWVSACLLANSSYAGEQGVPIELAGTIFTGTHTTSYPNDEGAYWGDVFNDNGAGQVRYGCQGTNARETYYSAAMGGDKALLSRSCGYFNTYFSCDICDVKYTQTGNHCEGHDHPHYFMNLDAAYTYPHVKSCTTMCSTDAGTNGGFFNNCGTSVGHDKAITVWRQ